MGNQRNIRLVLQYDGGNYCGFQIQPHVPTIQQVLEDCILKLTQQTSRVTAAGRTDSGVHALQQVVHFHTTSPLPVEVLQRGLNALLPSDIRIVMTDELSMEFHARFSATGKRYVYRLWNGPVKSVFQDRYTWWVPEALDLQAMKEASAGLAGCHDFSSFRSAGCDARHGIREVKGCGWVQARPVLVFWIEANAFLRYMVRTMVGTLVEIGLGKRRADSMAALVRDRDRKKAGITAPARGLFLTRVYYPPPWNTDLLQRRGIVDQFPSVVCG